MLPECGPIKSSSQEMEKKQSENFISLSSFNDLGSLGTYLKHNTL